MFVFIMVKTYRDELMFTFWNCCSIACTRLSRKHFSEYQIVKQRSNYRKHNHYWPFFLHSALIARILSTTFFLKTCFLNEERSNIGFQIHYKHIFSRNMNTTLFIYRLSCDMECFKGRIEYFALKKYIVINLLTRLHAETFDVCPIEKEKNIMLSLIR